jgi:hypothetical protein
MRLLESRDKRLPMKHRNPRPLLWALQLGAAHPGGMCNGNTINPNYTGYANNKAIFQAESPYFVNPAASLQYSDEFAETWAPYQQGFNSSILPFFDFINGQMHCSATVLVSLLDTGLLPNAAKQSYPSGCSVVTDSQLTTNIQ